MHKDWQNNQLGTEPDSSGVARIEIECQRLLEILIKFITCFV